MEEAAIEPSAFCCDLVVQQPRDEREEILPPYYNSSEQRHSNKDKQIKDKQNKDKLSKRKTDHFPYHI